MALRLRKKKTSSPKIKTQVERKIHASVSFNGTQFIITNNDSFDWTNVKFELNAGILKSGYILRENRIKSGHTYTVGALQFAKSGGERFNPFTMKPQSMFIFADEGNCELGWK